MPLIPPSNAMECSRLFSGCSTMVIRIRKRKFVIIKKDMKENGYMKRSKAGEVEVSAYSNLFRYYIFNCLDGCEQQSCLLVKIAIMLSSSAEKNSILVTTVVLVIAAAGVTAVQAWKVQIVPKMTSVKYVVPVVTSFTTVPSTCYVPMNVTGDCRRRRSIEEKPDIISLGDDIDVENIFPTLPRYNRFIIFQK